MRAGGVAMAKVLRYAHAKQLNRHRKQVKFLRDRFGRVICDIERKKQSDKAITAVFAQEQSMRS